MLRNHSYLPHRYSIRFALFLMTLDTRVHAGGGRVRSAHLSPGLPMGFTRVNPGWALSLILKKWVLSGSSLFLTFTFVFFTVT